MPREVCKKETHVPTASGLLEGCFRRKRGETEHSRKKALIECRCATMYVSLLALVHCSLRSNSSAHSLGAFPRILLTMPYLFYFFLSFQVMEFQKHAFHPHFNLLLLQLMFPFLPFNGCVQYFTTESKISLNFWSLLFIQICSAFWLGIGVQYYRMIFQPIFDNHMIFFSFSMLM